MKSLSIKKQTKYTATCKNCGVILKSSNDHHLALKLWPWSYNYLICWFCGYKHITDEHIEYKCPRSLA